MPRKQAVPSPDPAADVERLCLEADRRDAERLERQLAAQQLDWTEHQRAVIRAAASRYPGHDLADVIAAIGEPGTDWTDERLVRRARLLCKGKRPGVLRRVTLPQDYDAEQASINAARIARDTMTERTASIAAADDDDEIQKEVAAMGRALEPMSEIRSVFEFMMTRDMLDEQRRARKKSGPSPAPDTDEE